VHQFADALDRPRKFLISEREKGFEPVRGDGKPFAGRAVAVYRLEAIRFTMPPRSIACHSIPSKTTLEGDIEAAARALRTATSRRRTAVMLKNHAEESVRFMEA
jgi:hypothetical protein